MSVIDNYLAYIKYEGELVKDGYLDLRKSAEALTGIDEVLRYFLYQEDQELKLLDFEIPARIKKGSWEALIPHNIADWLQMAAGVGMTIYTTTALQKLAENDFKDKTFKDIFKGAFKSIKWVIRIATHVKSMKKKQFDKVTFKENNTLIGIPNEQGEILYVPKKYLDLYVDCPEHLFAKIAGLIEIKRELVIGVNKDEAQDQDDLFDIRINYSKKYIFTNSDTDDEILFPDLEHGAYVELDGHISRGNENTNSIGFLYVSHILNCYPAEGNVNKYAHLMFSNCIMKGYVDRLDKTGGFNEKKPKIKFIALTKKVDKNKTLPLL